MKWNKKAFSIVELAIVLILIAGISVFWFSKLSVYFDSQNTLSSISNIKREVLKNKIESSLNNQKISINFSKNMKTFFTLYSSNTSSVQNFKIFSWAIKEESIEVVFMSNQLKTFSWKIYFDDEQTIHEFDIFFNEEGMSNEIVFFWVKKLEKINIYLKDEHGVRKTWILKIKKYSSNNGISLHNILWIDFSSKELALDNFEITNINTSKFNYYSTYNDMNIQLLKLKTSFIDKNGLGDFLEFY